MWLCSAELSRNFTPVSVCKHLSVKVSATISLMPSNTGEPSWLDLSCYDAGAIYEEIACIE